MEIVDRLELVDVQEQQRERLGVRGRLGGERFERGVEPAPVEETRQRIDVDLGADLREILGQLLHPRLALLQPRLDADEILAGLSRLL
jgi:hypothetical protein